MAVHQEIHLIPIGIKNLMRIIKKVSMCTVCGYASLLVIMWVAVFFHDWITGVVFSITLLFITIPILIPGFMFDKVSQSVVCLEIDRINVLDKKGVCWRSIDYNAITAVRVEEVSGFFYGHNKNLFSNKYICIFLNEETTIPNVSYAKLFSAKEFLLFDYQAEALKWLQDRIITEDGSVSSGGRGDGSIVPKKRNCSAFSEETE